MLTRIKSCELNFQDPNLKNPTRVVDILLYPPHFEIWLLDLGLWILDQVFKQILILIYERIVQLVAIHTIDERIEIFF